LEKYLFVNWIISIDLCRVVSRSVTVAEIVNILLVVYSNYSLSTVDKNWLSIFINRYKKIRLYFFRQYNYQYILNKDLKLLQNWFSDIQYIIDKNSIQPENIYNFDKTGFAIDFIFIQKIII